jgi:hypothetical protein
MSGKYTSFGHLRDVENYLLNLAIVSVHDQICSVYVLIGSRFLKDIHPTTGLLPYFCWKLIQGIQATVNLLTEQEKIGPHDRPYTRDYYAALEHQTETAVEAVNKHGGLWGLVHAKEKFT